MSTPTGPIVSVASVAITPSTAAFNQQLRAGLASAQRAISDAADDMGDSIAREITRGVVEARLALATLGAGLNERFKVTLNVVENTSGSLLRMGMTATKVGAAFGGLGIAIGGAASALGGLLTVASQASGILIGLPAVIGSAALVMGTLKIATKGVGDAMGAALSGDAEKFSAAMEKLSPSAQAAANTIAMLKPQIDKLKTSVQENFFQQLSKSFGDFAIQATQLAGAGLPRIATSLGNIGNEFFTTATKGGTFFTGMRSLIDQTVSGLDRWKGVMPEVANALGNLFQVGSGFAGDMIAGVGVLIKQFATWVNTAAQTGKLQAMFQTALDTIAQLGRIIKNFGDIFGAVMFAASSSGVTLLDTLETISRVIAEFLNSDLGQASLEQLMGLAREVFTVVGNVIQQLLPIIGALAVSFGSVLTTVVTNLAGPIQTFIHALGELTTSAAPGIMDALLRIGSSFGAVLTAVSPLLPVIGQLIGLLASNFATIMDIVAQLIINVVAAIQPMLPTITQLIGDGLTVLVQILGTLLSAITPLLPTLAHLITVGLQGFVKILDAVLAALEPILPVLVELAQKVLTAVANHFEKLFNAIEPLIPVIVELVTKGFEILAQILPVIFDAFKPLLPIIMDIGKELITALAPILPAIADAFKEIFETVKPMIPVLAQLAGDILVTLAKLFTALVKAVLPIVPPLIEIAMVILATLMPAFNQLLQALIPLLPVISELAVKLLRDALLPIIQALLPIVPILVDALVQLLPSFVDLLPPLVDLIITLTPIITLLADLAKVILEVVVPVVVLFMTTVNELRAVALALLGAAIDALVVLIKIAWDAIATAIQVAWLIIKGIFDIMISLLQGDFSEAWRRLETLIKDVWDRLKTFISDTIGIIVNYLIEWGPKLYTAAKNAVQRIADAFGEIFGGIFASFGNWIVETVKGMNGIKSAVFLFFSDAGKWLYEKGKDLLQGFINGFEEKAQALYDKLQGVIDKAKGLWDKATGFLFGSPSKWMIQRGKWVVEGFAQGLDKETPTAVNATQNLIDSAKRPIESGIATNATPDLSAMLNGLSGGRTVGTTTAAAGMTIVFGEGSVVVSFEGVVPTDAEARRTGQLVGQGISDVMARRDAQLAVRVM